MSKIDVADSMRLSVLRVVFAFLVLLLAASETNRNFLAAGPPTLLIDGSQRFQRIDGFGVNANPASWNDGQLKPALDLLVDDFGMTIWRVIVEKADWETINDNNDPHVFNWDYYRNVYENPKFRDLWSTVAYLNSKRVEVLLNVMGVVPGWMGGTVIKETAEDEWVEMITSLIYYGRKVRKLQFRLLSPLNETDIGSPEGPLIGPAQYVRLLKKLIFRLEALGLRDIRIVAPDTASIDVANSTFLPALLTDGIIMSKLAHVGVHNYTGRTGNVGQTINQSRYAERSFWLTEWAAPCDRCDDGRGPEDEWNFAKRSTINLLNHLRDGAAAGIFYEGYDSYYEHHGSQSLWGLLAYDTASQTYTPRKRLYTNAHLTKFIAPGAFRIKVAASNQSLNILALYHTPSRQLTLAGHNPLNASQVVRFKMTNLPAFDTLAVYETTRSLNLRHSQDVHIKAGEVSIHLAPDSFFTLTGTTQ